jgi:hypothetical protein
MILGPTAANAEDWAPLYACFDANVEIVEQMEPSIHDAADLLVDVVCLDEAVALGNEMLGTRNNVVSQKGHGSAFSDFINVMKREAKSRVFDVRKERLGL